MPGTFYNPGGSGEGVTDHGALDGLGDDDHTQYVETDEVGTAAALDVGTAIGDVVQLVDGGEAGGSLPAVDGAALINMPYRGSADIGSLITGGGSDDMILIQGTGGTVVNSAVNISAIHTPNTDTALNGVDQSVFLAMV